MNNDQRRDTYDHLVRELWSFAADVALVAVCTALRDEEVDAHGEEACLERARAWLEAFRLVEAALGAAPTLMDVRHLLFPGEGAEKESRHGDAAARLSVVAEMFETEYSGDPLLSEETDSPDRLARLRLWIARLQGSVEVIEWESIPEADAAAHSRQEGPE